MDNVNLTKGIIVGCLSGIVWGLMAILVNHITGVFTLEESLLREMMTFSLGGAVFGMVIGGFLALTSNRLPFKSSFLKAVSVSVAIWLILRVGGVLLSYANPERFHPDRGQAIQGFVMAIVLGLILATFLKVAKKRHS
jgi:MFS family permease